MITKNSNQFSKPFAEIIESSLDLSLAQSWQWDTFPIFGSLLQATSNAITILGVVTEIKTGSMDPMRYPFPYQKTEKELKAEQPQIFEFLKTTFQIKVLGFMDNEKNIQYRLPPHPCKIHSFVTKTSSQISNEFFSKPDFLYLLFSQNTQILHLDDLLLAIFKQLSQNGRLTASILDSFSQTMSLLTGNDYRKIKLLLKRTESILCH